MKIKILNCYSAAILPELKDTLLQLAEAVNVMIEKLHKKWYAVSIDGLIKAAENLDKLGKPVILLAKKALFQLKGETIE